MNQTHLSSGINYIQPLVPYYVLRPAKSFFQAPFISDKKRVPKNCAPPPQKRFLVFDRSGDKTTLIYSSLIENPTQYGACLVPRPPPSTYNSQMKETPMKTFNPLNPSMKDERIEDHSLEDMEHEIREDTEELNALLCSDSNSDYLKDDEEMSTGRSPSTMADNQMGEETGEEANSFTGLTKRQKHLDGSYDAPFLRRTCSSPKEGFGSLCCYTRKERIEETLSMLQSIFPNLEGNNPVAFIDKIIQYLRSLKVETKALGFDSD